MISSKSSSIAQLNLLQNMQSSSSITPSSASNTQNTERLFHALPAEPSSTPKYDIDILEAKARKERTPSWFLTFAQNSTQKMNTFETLKKLIKKYIDNEFISFTSPIVLDVGCGNGILSENIAKLLVENKLEALYCCIEKDPDFVNKTTQLLTNVGIKNDVINGDCFEKIHEFSHPINLLILSHVAYYLPEYQSLLKFITAAFSRMKENGVALMVHGACDSDINDLGKKYKTSQFCDIPSNITLAINEYDKSLLSEEYFQTIKLESDLNFPPNMNQLWEDLEKCSYESVYISDKENFIKAKYLLEFIIRTPLETLHYKKELSEYLLNVKTRLEKQNNKLILRDIIHIVIPKNKKNSGLQNSEMTKQN